MKNIPVLHVTGKTLSETYEKALIKLYNEGCRFQSQYDKPEDPESIDATMNLTIEEPMTDPMIHKAFPGSIADLREYVMELEGFKNDWTKNTDDPKDTRWEYTYNSRLTQYGLYKKKHGIKETIFGDGDEDYAIDQIKIVIDKLIKSPFTRQAQAVLWSPLEDNSCYDPACWQSLWARITEEGGTQYLNTNIRFRSNDSWNACVMNMFGITIFIKEKIIDEYCKRTGKNLMMGRMNWQADSWHIYGKDIKQFEERFFNRILTTGFEDRVYNFYDPEIQEMYHECEPDILKKIRNQTEEFKNSYDK